MSERVMIVEDSLTIRMDLVEAFEGAGFHPLPCATIAEARDTLARDRIDIAVLDVVLPDGDGIELLRQIRSSETPGVPVLVLSSETEIGDRVRALKIGADDYVGKPYDRTYVISKARELLRARTGAVTSQKTVLIVDDSMTFRETLRAHITAAGYAVITAETGEDGLRVAADMRPQVLIVDGVLPGIDGATVIRHIRLDAALRGMPCLLLTGSDEQGAELHALEAGADGFVRKDEAIDVILARLAAALRHNLYAAGEVRSLGPRKILVVDDSPTFLNEIAGTLRGEGYDLVLARSGEQALELLAVEPVDCILLDLEMPGLGGRETCRRIKSAPVVRDIPLVILTANEDRAAMVEGLAAGADDYIVKSADLPVLKARVRAQLRRKQFEDETRHIREQLLRKELEATEARAASELAEARAAFAEELARKNKELEAFSYSVAHDLRAPIRAIDGFSAILEEDFTGQLEDQARSYVRRIRSATQRMSALIEDLIKLARITGTQLVVQRVDLAPLAETILRELRERTPERSVEFRIGTELVVHGDPGLLHTVLENLVGNAWKFTSKRAHAVIEIGRAGPAIFVRDNGVGFDQSRADTVFQPFQRLHAATQFEGTGIGLATVQRIVARHGGRIWAEAAVDRGATVFFTLEGGE